MTKPQWETFLSEYNAELLTYEQIVEALQVEIIRAGRLGYVGASEKELAATEKRLGTTLPPSYRAFLSVSNGWRFPSAWILNLLPSAKVQWFRKQNQDWIDAYVGPSAALPPLSDDEYFVYGRDQDCVKFRTEYLQTALQISDACDRGVVLLNPKVITPDGEWETWFFANWLPGVMRYRSFAEWLSAERKTCRNRLASLPKSKVEKYVTSKSPVSVKKAQEAARSGQTELALESLEAFAAKGDDSAAASLAELYAFLGQWDKIITNAGRLIANPRAVYAGNVFNDMIQLLGRAGQRSGEWTRVTEVVEAASKANASRHAQLRAREKDKIRRDIVTDQEQRNEKLFRNLIEYATRQGKPPHELLAIFGVRGCMDGMGERERKVWYENAVKNAESVRPDLKTNLPAKMEYCFSLAKGVLEDEALRLYEAHGNTFGMKWQAAEYVAPIYVRRENADTAWAALERNLKHWWPVDHAQVAPLVLLTNEHLEKLMTPERCRLVLSTPRGPEGAKTASK
jgi:hypothetical protein